VFTHGLHAHAYFMFFVFVFFAFCTLVLFFVIEVCAPRAQQGTGAGGCKSCSNDIARDACILGYT
jgi:hypothetical protein